MVKKLLIIIAIALSLNSCGTYTTGGTRYTFDFTNMFTNMFVDEVSEQAAQAAAEREKAKQSNQQK